MGGLEIRLSIVLVPILTHARCQGGRFGVAEPRFRGGSPFARH